MTTSSDRSKDDTQRGPRESSTWTRVPHDDPALIAAYSSDEQLAGYLRLRLLADQAWPASPSIPRLVTEATLAAFAKAGHIELMDGDRYRMPAIDAERTARREQASAAGKASGKARGNKTPTPVERPLNPRPTPVERQPNLPDADVEVDAERDDSKAPTSVNARARQEPDVRLTREQHDAWSAFDEHWQPFKEAWLAKGLRLPPSGDRDDDGTQAGLLAQIADARPNDLGRWVREAKGKTPREIIEHVLERWHAVRDGVAATEEAWRRAKGEGGRAATGRLTRVGDELSKVVAVS